MDQPAPRAATLSLWVHPTESGEVARAGPRHASPRTAFATENRVHAVPSPFRKRNTHVSIFILFFLHRLCFSLSFDKRNNPIASLMCQNLRRPHLGSPPPPRPCVPDILPSARDDGAGSLAGVHANKSIARQPLYWEGNEHALGSPPSRVRKATFN